jgi:hypothetical protein
MTTRKARYAMYLMLVVLLTGNAPAQNIQKESGEGSGNNPAAAPGSPRLTEATRGPVAIDTGELTPRERMLLDRIEALERRLADHESRSEAAGSTASCAGLLPGASATASAPAAAIASGPAATTARSTPAAAAAGTPADSTATVAKGGDSQVSDDERGILDYLRGTTINLTLDGYYSYNFNRPVGRINLLRVYDVSSNSFSLNQATMVIERAPDVQAGRRFGVRLDLQYGQATEALQGSAANESRPQAYRPVWQAYGTYIAPLGSGLTVDFGKWASALGYENNYTKDQINYSRSYLFNFLPLYHFGFRSSYNLSDKLNVSYWLVNGAQQSEDFNGFKSQAVLLTWKPSKTVSWNLNYYTGVEGRDTVPALNPGFPALPTQPGLSTDVIRPAPDGRLHILDSYVNWNATPKLTLAAEGDYVVNRFRSSSAPSHVSGGALYARYQLAPKFSLAGRVEYLSDRDGLFSGTSQLLKETTVTADYKFAEGFLARGEWRRDFSNRPFFLTDVPGLLKKEQNTATLGLIWWFGRKQGSW